jgi:hypothetical protein
MAYPSEWLKKSPVSALPSISGLSWDQNWSACANVADKPDEEPYITSTPPASITASTTEPTFSNGTPIAKSSLPWLWNLIDDGTRFWISGIVSQRREIVDARRVYQDAKQKTGIPKAIIHDGLPSYDEAFQKEYFTLKNPRVKNIRSISVRNEGLNSVVERLNGSVRDREKVMRGMNSKDSAQKIIEAMRIHYNFCREHSKLGKTPAEASGIKIEGKNKLLTLIQNAKQ